MNKNYYKPGLFSFSITGLEKRYYFTTKDGLPSNDRRPRDEEGNLRSDTGDNTKQA